MTSYFNQNVLKNLLGEYRTTHRWILHEILYNSFVNENDSTEYNILFGLSCRIIAGIIGMYIYEYTQSRLYIYNITIIISFIVFMRNIYQKKNEKNNRS